MENRSRRKIIDLTHRLDEETTPFPGDPPVKIAVHSIRLEPGDGRQRISASELTTSLHCGTHMDAPFHFFADGRTIDEVPLEACCGPALLLRLPASSHQGRIDADHLSPHGARIKEVARVVINTGWHHRWGSSDYFTAHPVITKRAAELLVEHGVRLVGVDTPSVDQAPYETHLSLLGNGVLIIENLTNLDAITNGVFELCALPLKVGGRDGSPVRAVALMS
jgi:kynurenine formamidase